MLSLAEHHKNDLDPRFYREVLKGLAEAHLRRGDFAIGVAGYKLLLQDETNPAQRVAFLDRIERAENALSENSKQKLIGLTAKGRF